MECFSVFHGYEFFRVGKYRVGRLEGYSFEALIELYGGRGPPARIFRTWLEKQRAQADGRTHFEGRVGEILFLSRNVGLLSELQFSVQCDIDTSHGVWWRLVRHPRRTFEAHDACPGTPPVRAALVLRVQYHDAFRDVVRTAELVAQLLLDRLMALRFSLVPALESCLRCECVSCVGMVRGGCVVRYRTLHVVESVATRGACMASGCACDFLASSFVSCGLCAGVGEHQPPWILDWDLSQQHRAPAMWRDVLLAT